MTRKRNANYYEKRLERDFPAVHRDLLAGKYKSVNEASAAAGLKPRPTPFVVLKREWKKASASERRDFVDWLKTGAPAPSRKAARAPASKPPVTGSDGRLTPAGIARIEKIMNDRSMTTGDVMQEIGFKKLNQALGNALHQGRRIRDPGMIAALERWVEDNEP